MLQQSKEKFKNHERLRIRGHGCLILDGAERS